MLRKYKTGESCPRSGVWEFAGYLDGTSSPAPSHGERLIPLSLNERFPPIRSANKGCWWNLREGT